MGLLSDLYRRYRKYREIRYNNTRVRYNEREWFFRQVFDYLNESGVRGDYYEFGCHKAMTFRMALREAHRKNIDWMSFYAFDSFQGLPKAEGLDDTDQRAAAWQEGALCTTEERFLNLVRRERKYLDRIHLVKGFYNESLTDELQRQLSNGPGVALAFVDCDLYESARDVLRFIEPLLRSGAVIYLDDYFHYRGDPERGERKALREFEEYSRYHLLPHLQVAWFGKSFIVHNPGEDANDV